MHDVTFIYILPSKHIKHLLAANTTVRTQNEISLTCLLQMTS